MALRVLLTGFEPFDGANVNASEALVNAMAAERLPGVELHIAVLPVLFDAAANELLTLVDSVAPDVVLATGLAQGRNQLSFERVAINFEDAAIPDNAGQVRRGNAIAANGPTGYFATLPVERLVAAAQAVGTAAAVSLSAGSFVCNQVFYKALHELTETEVRVGFLHLPLLESQQLDYPNLPTMPLSEMVRGLSAALQALVLEAE